MRTTVYFATNRAVTNAGTAVPDYGNGIVAPSDPGLVTYGTAYVDGTDVATNTAGRIASIQDVALGSFDADTAGDLGAPGRNILVFLHGFDNSFEDALTRAALNRAWMAASGAVSADMSVVAFSWPSLGRLVGLPFLTSDYQHDQVMAGQSGVHVMDFLLQLRPLLDKARQDGARCFLLCHSMGHWALQAAVESWFSHGHDAVELFDEAFLAAGDERFDSFSFPAPGRLSNLASLARRTSIYFSQADSVLALSMVANWGLRRLGQEGPQFRTEPARFPPDRFRMVDCTDIRDYAFDLMSSHQYYRLSPQVRADIVSVL